MVPNRHHSNRLLPLVPAGQLAGRETVATTLQESLQPRWTESSVRMPNAS